MNIASAAAHAVSTPSLMQTTSHWQIVNVFPGLMTEPRAISRSPLAGASKFVLNSTVTADLANDPLPHACGEVPTCTARGEILPLPFVLEKSWS
jgi:hypothetical protein